LEEVKGEFEDEVEDGLEDEDGKDKLDDDEHYVVTAGHVL
jgi:hypothetical protein